MPGKYRNCLTTVEGGHDDLMREADSVVLIESAEALVRFADEAQRAPIIAADTEAASFHRYLDRIYLLQVSTPHRTAVIDPLAVPDLGPVGALLADPAVETVFHDADYDLRTLNRDYGFAVRRLFDTRIAAQLLGEDAVGLAALLERHFGVRLTKKWQRADWSRRPLRPEMIAYAAADTAHLIPLRDFLAQRLEDAGRMHWALEEFTRCEAVRWSAPEPAERAHLRLKGARHLPPRERLVLQALYQWRDAEARRRDRPPFRIMPNDALVAVARRLPRRPADLRGVDGLPTALAVRYAAALLKAVAAGLTVPLDSAPERRSSPQATRDPAHQARVERLKTARTRVATALRLDPGVLCGKAVLEAVARAAPTTLEELRTVPELREWQVEVLGRALLSALGR